MKLLSVCVLGCAMMALTKAAAVPEEKAEDDQTESSDLVKRYLFCSSGWTKINGACFQYVPAPMSWAQAERNCVSMKAHLASVHSVSEYQEIQRMIAAASHAYKQTWIGGTNAQEVNVWMWSDGNTFDYSNWCPGEPNNLGGQQRCLQMNYGDQKCWDDVECDTALPSVCAQRGWGLVG